MPNQDRTGPMGQGPMTGGRRGLCANPKSNRTDAPEEGVEIREDSPEEAMTSVGRPRGRGMGMGRGRFRGGEGGGQRRGNGQGRGGRGGYGRGFRQADGAKANPVADVVKEK